MKSLRAHRVLELILKGYERVCELIVFWNQNLYPYVCYFVILREEYRLCYDFLVDSDTSLL